MNKAVCGTKESAPGKDALDDWVETVLMPTLVAYSPNDIYNGDETALFYKCLPHRTYCFGADKPAGSAKRKDRITLMMITNMSGSDCYVIVTIRQNHERIRILNPASLTHV